MSIVEKALQKAQQAPGAQPPAAQPPRPVEPQILPGAEPVEPTPVVAESARMEAPRPAPAGRPTNETIVVDAERLRQFGLLPAENLITEAMEEFRRIKWPLLEHALGRGGSGTVAAENNLILVTSAMAGEGKSFTSMSLAGTIGRERDCRVILVDADLSSPKLTEAMGLSGRPGLHELLSDDSVTLRDVVYPLSLEGVMFLPAGNGSDLGPELLASRRMAQVCGELSRWVPDGVVLFDSSPLLVSNEGQVMSRLVGQVLLVVLADATEQRLVREAIALLDRTKLISLVLNNVQRTGIADDPVTYGYGYGYGAKQRYGSQGGNGST